LTTAAVDTAAVNTAAVNTAAGRASATPLESWLQYANGACH